MSNVIDIAVLAGDAQGANEAVAAGLSALTAVGLTPVRHDLDLGADRYLRTGELLPAEELFRIRSSDALFCGSPPVGKRPDIAPGLLDRGIVFALRRELGLSVNVRSFTRVMDGVGVTVVRENSEGLYFSEGSVLHGGTSAALAVEVAVTSRHAVARCVRAAFELATRRRGRLTLAHKPAVLTASGRIWTEAIEQLAPEFPDVEPSVENVDTCCLRLVSAPDRYDVIVTDNVFGDIISDVACGALNALGHSASAEISHCDGPSLFEPVHGPQDGAGPAVPVSVLAAVRAAALLAGHLGYVGPAEALDHAVLAAAAADEPADSLAAVLAHLPEPNSGPPTDSKVHR